MKCFRHPEVDAVGICKACNKGLCLDCAVDVGNGLACKDSCEAEVKSINDIVEHGKSVYKKTGRFHVMGGVLFLLFGFFILATTAFDPIDPSAAVYFSALSIFLVLSGVVFLWFGRRYFQKR